MTRARTLRGAARGLLLAAAVGLVGCAHGVLNPAGPVARAERLLLFNALAVMLAIVLPVIGLAFGFAWWFRAGNKKAKHRPDWSYSGQLELLVWSVPLLTIIFLAGIAWTGSHELDPPKPLAAKTPALEVDVVALDWKWLFIYPRQGVASVNRLVLPVGVPVRFRLASATVMNSFFIPRLGSQIYAMVGMETRLNLLADVPGTFEGLSAQYSGAGFVDMRFLTTAVPAAGFAAWVEQARASPQALDLPAYTALANTAATSPPRLYRLAAPGLFETALKLSSAPRDRAVPAPDRMAARAATGSPEAVPPPVERAPDSLAAVIRAPASVALLPSPDSRLPATPRFGGGHAPVQ